MEIKKNITTQNWNSGTLSRIKYIVLHYTGNNGDTALANTNYFKSYRGASAHYFVDENNIYQSIEDKNIAWHCGAISYKHPYCRNSNSIGIEMCCHLDAQGSWTIDEATMAAAAELGRDIMARYGIPLENVLRHYDVTGKLCPRPLIDEGKWAAFKARLEDTMTQEQFNSMMDTYLAQLRAQEVSGWGEAAWKKAMAAGVFDGTAPQASLTREQAALVLDRLGLLAGR